MLNLTPEQLMTWTGARLVREGAAPFADPIPGVSSDSRSLQPGELFIALHGDRFDGHDFLAQSAERGAAALLVDDAQALPEFDIQTASIPIPSTMRACVRGVYVQGKKSWLDVDVQALLQLLEQALQTPQTL